MPEGSGWKAEGGMALLSASWFRIPALIEGAFHGETVVLTIDDRSPAPRSRVAAYHRDKMEPGALEQVAALASEWFLRYLEAKT
jgi:hypothetical protein